MVSVAAWHAVSPAQCSGMGNSLAAAQSGPAQAAAYFIPFLGALDTHTYHIDC